MENRHQSVLAVNEEATLAQARVGYRLTPDTRLALDVFNLFNTMYYDSLMASDGGRAVPGSGTTGLLTFTYRM